MRNKRSMSNVHMHVGDWISEFMEYGQLIMSHKSLNSSFSSSTRPGDGISSDYEILMNEKVDSDDVLIGLERGRLRCLIELGQFDTVVKHVR